MSLRDRFSADYFIPLVAGIPDAQRGGVLAPAEVYGPGLFAGGVGEPGGIGEGDGGNQTTDCTGVNKPSITSPASDATNVLLDATITSSAFSSTDGQTHIKSRWVIELRGGTATTGPQGVILYDSGPDSTNLTSLPLTDIDIPAGAKIAVKVRHKGSSASTCWSAWSEYLEFTTRGCGPVPIVITQYEADLSPPGGYDSSDLGGHYVPAWRNTMAEVATDLGTAATLYNAGGTGATYVGHVENATDIGVYNTASPPGCSVPGTCFRSYLYHTITRTGPYGTSPDPCIPMPPPPVSPPPPPPPVFVPPPPAASPTPSTQGEPPTQASFANIVLDMTHSYVCNQPDLDAGMAPRADVTPLSTVLANGGVQLTGDMATVGLVFQNTGNVAGSVWVSVSGTWTRDPGDGDLPGPGVLPYAAIQITVPPHSFAPASMLGFNSGYIWLLRSPTPDVPATYTLTIDLGDGNPITFNTAWFPLPVSTWL